MVKVVPTEGTPVNEHNDGNGGKEEHVITSDHNVKNTNDTIQAPLIDDDAEAARTGTQAADHTTDEACAEAKGQPPDVNPSDSDDVHKKTIKIDTDVPPVQDTTTSSEGNEVQEVLPAREASGGDWAAGEIVSQLPPSALDMEKHSGMTTFSLMRQGSNSDPGQETTAEGEAGETHDEASTEIPADLGEGEDDDDDQLKDTSVAFARRGTRRFVRQDTGIGVGDGVLCGGGKKKRPFRVPQTMYMGHPLGSPAAEFLERQHHRLADVKTRREVVARRVGLVMEHNPLATGSGLPDIDEVFPDKKDVGDNSHGDWCV